MYDNRPLVCKVYPFSYAYGTFMSLIMCPLGEKIAMDFIEFGEEIGACFGDRELSSYVDNTVNAVDKFNRDLGVVGGKSMKSLMFAFKLFFEFSAWARRKHRWKKQK